MHFPVGHAVTQKRSEQTVLSRQLDQSALQLLVSEFVGELRGNRELDLSRHVAEEILQTLGPDNLEHGGDVFLIS